MLRLSDAAGVVLADFDAAFFWFVSVGVACYVVSSNYFWF